MWLRLPKRQIRIWNARKFSWVHKHPQHSEHRTENLNSRHLGQSYERRRLSLAYKIWWLPAVQWHLIRLLDWLLLIARRLKEANKRHVSTDVSRKQTVCGASYKTRYNRSRTNINNEIVRSYHRWSITSSPPRCHHRNSQAARCQRLCPQTPPSSKPFKYRLQTGTSNYYKERNRYQY